MAGEDDEQLTPIQLKEMKKQRAKDRAYFRRREKEVAKKWEVPAEPSWLSKKKKGAVLTQEEKDKVEAKATLAIDASKPASAKFALIEEVIIQLIDYSKIQFPDNRKEDILRRRINEDITSAVNANVGGNFDELINNLNTELYQIDMCRLAALFDLFPQFFPKEVWHLIKMFFTHFEFAKPRQEIVDHWKTRMSDWKKHNDEIEAIRKANGGKNTFLICASPQNGTL